MWKKSPGRFFAVTEVKTVLARILLNYDIKLSDEKTREPQVAGVALKLNKSAEIFLRKRNLN